MRTFIVVIQLLSIAISAPLACGWAPSTSSYKVRKSPKSFAIAARSNKHSGNDPTKAIKEALMITKKYGTTSFRAKIAWEVVEKIEYSYQVRSKSNTDKKKLDLVAGYTNKKDVVVDIVDGDEAYDLVENNVRDLKELLDKEMAKVKEMKDIAHKIKEVRKSTAIHETKTIEAIAAAREATKSHGIHSAQTVLAWEEFDNIVSDGLAP